MTANSWQCVGDQWNGDKFSMIKNVFLPSLEGHGYSRVCACDDSEHKRTSTHPTQRHGQASPDCRVISANTPLAEISAATRHIAIRSTKFRPEFVSTERQRHGKWTLDELRIPKELRSDDVEQLGWCDVRTVEARSFPEPKPPIQDSGRQTKPVQLSLERRTDLEFY